MANIKDWITDKLGNIFIPKTLTSAVYDDNNIPLSETLDTLNSNLVNFAYADPLGGTDQAEATIELANGHKFSEYKFIWAVLYNPTVNIIYDCKIIPIRHLNTWGGYVLSFYNDALYQSIFKYVDDTHVNLQNYSYMQVHLYGFK